MGVSQALSYRIKAAVGKSQATSYRIRTTAGKSQPLSWQIKSSKSGGGISMAGLRPLVYRPLQQVGVSLSFSWRVRGLTTRRLRPRWQVRHHVAVGQRWWYRRRHSVGRSLPILVAGANYRAALADLDEDLALAGRRSEDA